MGNPGPPPAGIAALLRTRKLTWTWLSEATGIEYKRLLRVAKHRTQKLSLYDAALIADALQVDITVLVSEKEAA